jgi:hypothetical protein
MGSLITRQAWVVRNASGLYLTPRGNWTASRNLAWQSLRPETPTRLLRDGVLGDPALLTLEQVTYTTWGRYQWNWRAADESDS